MNKYEEAYQNGYGAVVKTITKLAAAAGGQEKTAAGLFPEDVVAQYGQHQAEMEAAKGLDLFNQQHDIADSERMLDRAVAARNAKDMFPNNDVIPGTTLGNAKANAEYYLQKLLGKIKANPEFAAGAAATGAATGAGTAALLKRLLGGSKPAPAPEAKGLAAALARLAARR